MSLEVSRSESALRIVLGERAPISAQLEAWETFALQSKDSFYKAQEACISSLKKLQASVNPQNLLGYQGALVLAEGLDESISAIFRTTVTCQR